MEAIVSMLFKAVVDYFRSWYSEKEAKVAKEKAISLEHKLESIKAVEVEEVKIKDSMEKAKAAAPTTAVAWNSGS